MSNKVRQDKRWWVIASVVAGLLVSGSVIAYATGGQVEAMADGGTKAGVEDNASAKDAQTSGPKTEVTNPKTARVLSADLDARFTGGIETEGVTEMAWARERGLLTETAKEQESMKQAMFLNMLVTVYEPKEKGVIVPQGAENHWAAGYYATAKREGIISCGCQIKPESSLTLGEAAKLVTNAVNLKRGKHVLEIEGVQQWIVNGHPDKSLTNQEAARLIWRMSEVLKE